jgi:hypothetical protein
MAHADMGSMSTHAQPVPHQASKAERRQQLHMQNMAVSQVLERAIAAEGAHLGLPGYGHHPANHPASHPGNHPGGHPAQHHMPGGAVPHGGHHR